MIQVLQTIGLVLGIAFYAAAGFCLVNGWIRLRRMESDVNDARIAATQTLFRVTGDHIKQSFEDVNKMRDTLRRLVEQERYEEAKRLKAVIAETERIAMTELRDFKERFADNIDEVSLTNNPFNPLNEGKEDDE